MNPIYSQSNRNHLYILVSLFFAIVFLPPASAGESQILWYKESISTPGDMLVGRVMVDQTAPFTYYEVLGWNSGGLGGGYAGIQDNGGGIRSFIFSIWDPTPTVQMQRAEFVPHGGSFGRRFGGEGTGFQIINPAKTAPLWNLGDWCTIVTRAWDFKDHTYVAAWLFENATSHWSLQGIHDFPALMHFDYGAVAFLENYGGQYLSTHRRMFTSAGYKRSINGIWMEFLEGNYTGPSFQANGGKNGMSYFMESGSTVANTVGTSASFTVTTSGVQPTWTTGAVDSVTAILDPQSLKAIVSWNVNTAFAPQFSYEIQFSSEAQFLLENTVIIKDSKPHEQFVTVPLATLPIGLIYGRIRIIDILDRTSSWREFSFTNNLDSVVGTNISSLVWISDTNGYGPVERDQSNGELGIEDGRTITLNGITYISGLGCHANSTINLNLNANAGQMQEWFISDIGVDDEMTGINGSVVFKVFVDGVLSFDSGLMNGSTTTQHVLVNVHGASVLSLMVTDGGDGVGQDHADWAGARIVGRNILCSSDLDCSGFVDSGDVGMVLLDTGECGGCSTDLDGSGFVDSGDVGTVLLDYGPCP